MEVAGVPYMFFAEVASMLVGVDQPLHSSAWRVYGWEQAPPVDRLKVRACCRCLLPLPLGPSCHMLARTHACIGL